MQARFMVRLGYTKWSTKILKHILTDILSVLGNDHLNTFLLLKNGSNSKCIFSVKYTLGVNTNGTKVINYPITF